MIGVNFQPGGGYSETEQNGNGPSRPSGGGVQEAIKILSLRLPKVVGAQGVTPMPLLTSQGGEGSRVDSVVNQVLSRLPQQSPAYASSPAMPAQTPTLDLRSLLSNLFGAQESGPAQGSYPSAPQRTPAPQSRVKMPSVKMYEPPDPKQEEAARTGPVFEPPPGMEPGPVPQRQPRDQYEAPQVYDTPLF